ncbi:unnamed protein product [Enterobius vermicularis]|uniref:GOLGA2L5 domain-containing protein n=1 Tax=Enterobius vermicularis TaxID=51028 RepID=A0A0N4UW03_ENTVE|nr:unnamed protein product [Enterobius vermicularis]
MESKSEKLAQARKKATSKLSEEAAENTGLIAESAPSFNHDEKRSPFEWLHQSSPDRDSVEPSEGFRNSDHCDLSTTSAIVSLENGLEANNVAEESTSETPLITAEEYRRVNDALSEALREKETLSTRLVELNQHYSEIYAAYNALVATVQSGGSGDSEIQTQLTQLRTAMSVIVEEKTSLQQKCREANEVAQRSMEELEAFKGIVKDKTMYIASLEQELGEIKRGSEESGAVIQRQKEELDKTRKEVVSLQANILHIQQDRNDAQERLKFSLKSAEQLQAELDETQKQLRMKDLYIRQLSFYSASATVNEQDIQNLHSENERLNAQIVAAQNEADQYRKEAQAAREHYEAYGAELNQKVLSLSNQLDEVSREKMILQDRLQTLEEEKCTRKPGNVDSNYAEVPKSENLQETTEHSANDSTKLLEEVENLKVQTSEAQQKINELEATASDYAKHCAELEKELSVKVTELEATNKNMSRLQNQIDEREKASQDFFRLSTELQNEKATLSRAIAQNRELKEQLIELQDKMISLSTKNMESESERLTGLHTIEQLKAEIAAMKGLTSLNGVSEGSGCDKTVSEETSKVFCDKTQNTEQVDMLGASSSNDTGVADEDKGIKAEERVAQLVSQIEELRSENRRIIQQNEELHRIMEQNAEDENQNNIHVELGQAIERIDTLSTENERLRNLNQELQKTQIITRNPELSSNAVKGDEPKEEVNADFEGHSVSSPLEKPFAWTELEARFAKVMRQNAELTEQNELLDHIIQQLQCENDTIGEYVTIYHHQRKLIQERVRARDEAVARLSLEKEQMKQKLNDLQSAVSLLFSSNDSFNKLAYRLNGASMHTPNHPEKPLNDYATNEYPEEAKQDNKNSSCPGLECVPHPQEFENGALSKAETSNENPVGRVAEDTGEVLEDKIMRLISELQDMEQARMHPPCAINICCKECRGKLITL